MLRVFLYRFSRTTGIRANNLVKLWRELSMAWGLDLQVVWMVVIYRRLIDFGSTIDEYAKRFMYNKNGPT